MARSVTLATLRGSNLSPLQSDWSCEELAIIKIQSLGNDQVCLVTLNILDIPAVSPDLTPPEIDCILIMARSVTLAGTKLSPLQSDWSCVPCHN